MITVRKAEGRHHWRRRQHDVWRTFYAQGNGDPFGDGFGSLRSLDEERLPPGGWVPRRTRARAEIITYVLEGALVHRDLIGNSGVLQAGEFGRANDLRPNRQQVRNASSTEWAHFFTIWLRGASEEIFPVHAERRFTAAERRGRLVVVAAPDGREGSLYLPEDTFVYTALLEVGHHVVHELEPGRMAWLHVIAGEVSIAGAVLSKGDAAAFVDERAVAITARKSTSLLLLDVVNPEALPEVDPAAPLAASLPARPIPRAQPSGIAVFGWVWTALVDVLGPSAAATLVSLATRRALPDHPELAELVISRRREEYQVGLPRSFADPVASRAALAALFAVLRQLLVEQTGQVVLRRFDRVPALREWRASQLGAVGT